jgi:hypothetical protein
MGASANTTVERTVTAKSAVTAAHLYSVRRPGGDSDYSVSQKKVPCDSAKTDHAAAAPSLLEPAQGKRCHALLQRSATGPASRASLSLRQGSLSAFRRSTRPSIPKALDFGVAVDPWQAKSACLDTPLLRSDLRGNICGSVEPEKRQPPTKGRGGGKLPSGNTALRSPARSFSAACR